MQTTKVFAPGHLTGLFQIHTEGDDPLYWGARGAGVSIDQGVHTSVSAEPSRRSQQTITINDQQVIDAHVSENVLSKYLSRVQEPYEITINHQIDTPITAGFGSSGGGALSLSFALNKVLDAGYTQIQAAQVAHVAEIECKTGLGSVFATYNGGFGVLYKPGAPGIGEGLLHPNTGNLRIIYLYFGPIHTKEALSNPELIKKINQLGGTFVEELHKELTPERFLRYSRSFTDHIELATPRIRAVFDHMDPHGFVFTMANFGEVAFTLQRKEKTDEIGGLLKEIDCTPVVCGVDKHGTIFQ